MLIKCPECELQVSDKAISCPHCGYPLQPSKLEKTSQNIKSKKRMRLPNSFGQITEIKGRNLRNPYRVMVPAGKTETGKPISKLLKPRAYFRTYNEAYTALVEYNKNPFDVSRKMTMEELYDEWIVKYEESASASRVRATKGAWNYCSSIYSMQVRDVRIRHLKDCVENGTRIDKENIIQIPSTMQKNVKFLFNMMLDYAVENEYTEKNYARSFTADTDVIEVQKDHMVFSEDELKRLWANIKTPFVDYILIQCYMGWRPTELIELETENVLLDQNIIIGGMKTKAGKQRPVPIHPKIKPLVERYYNEARAQNIKYLFKKSNEKNQMNYDLYRKKFHQVMEALDLNTAHRPHDPRKTFITMAKKYKVDIWAIKRIAGHKLKDITEETYTERDNEWLYNEICKIEADDMSSV